MSACGLDVEGFVKMEEDWSMAGEKVLELFEVRILVFLMYPVQISMMRKYLIHP